MPVELEKEVDSSGVEHKNLRDKLDVIRRFSERLSHRYSEFHSCKLETLGEMKQMRRGLTLHKSEDECNECWYVRLKAEPESLPEYLPTEFRGLRVFYEIPC